jgi:hypothetical protein
MNWLTFQRDAGFAKDAVRALPLILPAKLYEPSDTGSITALAKNVPQRFIRCSTTIFALSRFVRAT